VKKYEMGRAHSTNGVEGNSYRILVGKAEGKGQLGRPKCGWVNNIEIQFREIKWGGMDWIDLAQDMD
jgi:hypothetical protein